MIASRIHRNSVSLRTLDAENSSGLIAAPQVGCVDQTLTVRGRSAAKAEVGAPEWAG